MVIAVPPPGFGLVILAVTMSIAGCNAIAWLLRLRLWLFSRFDYRCCRGYGCGCDCGSVALATAVVDTVAITVAVAVAVAVVVAAALDVAVQVAVAVMSQFRLRSRLHDLPQLRLRLRSLLR